MEKKLYKSADDRVLAGVCGGLGEYFGIDPVIIRLLVVIITLAGGAGLIAYIIAAIIIPERPERKAAKYYQDADLYKEQDPDHPGRENPAEIKNRTSGKGLVIFGFILVALGAIVVLRMFIPWIQEELVLAVILVGLGLFFIIKKT